MRCVCIRRQNRWRFTETPYKFTNLKSTIRNPQFEINAPLTFQPIFMERIWGGRRLESSFGKSLPPKTQIGESWEIVDRPEAQSVVARGPLKGKTLHELWTKHRSSIFGEVPDAPRFPLLIKLLDAREKLSLQVHPPEQVARKLGGEPKTEFWYVADADPGAELLLGFCKPKTRDQFEKALREGTAADYVHKISAKPGDAAFLPAGRLHAVSAGNLLIEVQQNSDSTYRVFDWNRVDDRGKPRQLHIEQALQCIDFKESFCTARDRLTQAIRDRLLSDWETYLRRYRSCAGRIFAGSRSVAGSASEAARHANNTFACHNSSSVGALCQRRRGQRRSETRRYSLTPESKSAGPFHDF
ncbi:MAG: hypothetical protein DMF00_10350 [Verrucomicrobia bacterium]|nr:MAG: hypothetical protein DMF00_10350 [Verrucomicrobiota bacterium]